MPLNKETEAKPKIPKYSFTEAINLLKGNSLTFIEAKPHNSWSPK